jgi:hypothetical protein
LPPCVCLDGRETWRIRRASSLVKVACQDDWGNHARDFRPVLFKSAH